MFVGFRKPKYICENVGKPWRIDAANLLKQKLHPELQQQKPKKISFNLRQSVGCINSPIYRLLNTMSVALTTKRWMIRTVDNEM
jgi:hypothetical protein